MSIKSLFVAIIALIGVVFITPTVKADPLSGCCKASDFGYYFDYGYYPVPDVPITGPGYSCYTAYSAARFSLFVQFATGNNLDSCNLGCYGLFACGCESHTFTGEIYDCACMQDNIESFFTGELFWAWLDYLNCLSSITEHFGYFENGVRILSYDDRLNAVIMLNTVRENGTVRLSEDQYSDYVQRILRD